MMYRALTITLLCICLCGCKKQYVNPVHKGNAYIDHATDIAVGLIKTERTTDYLWPRSQWWNCANIMEAMLDYAKASGNDMSGMFNNIYSANVLFANGGFRNRSYDDCMWWAIAWIKAYELYGDERYLQTAEDIFAYSIDGGWDNHCGGGMNWQNIERYKNAITNELMILLAARLAKNQSDFVQKAYYLDWALKGWGWLDKSGMRNQDNLYNDGLTANCDNNQSATWTYNQGVILSALKELYLLTNDSKYLHIATLTANSTIQQLSINNVLVEPCSPNCNADGVQFKGIFIRCLGDFNTVVNNQAYKDFMIHNATVAWGNAKNSDNQFDVDWQGPYTDWTSSGTGAALDLMNAAYISSK